MNIVQPAQIYHNSDYLVYSCKYHIIFCPKYRRRVLVDPYDARLKEIFKDIAKQYNFEILEMEVMPDHVHMIVDCNPRFGIMECVRKPKGGSSHVLREEFPELKSRLPTMWTRSAFISSVGTVSLEVVKQYIENQKNK